MSENKNTKQRALSLCINFIGVTLGTFSGRTIREYHFYKESPWIYGYSIDGLWDKISTQAIITVIITIILSIICIILKKLISE